MIKKHRKALIVIGTVVLVIVAIMLSRQFTGNNGSDKKVEIMDLYGDIIPYQPMSYGDEYIASKVFDSLIRVDNFEIKGGLAAEFSIEQSKITIKLGNKEFKMPNETRPISNADILDYYNNILLKLTESNTITNPGLQNLTSVEEVNNDIVFTFNTESPVNILALTERIGYIHEDNWYGTQAKLEYNIPEIKVDNTSYIPVSNEKGLNNDERISNMMLAKVLADDTVNLEKVANGSYGFITWGSGSKVNNSDRQLIFEALEGSSIRKGLSLPINSIYAETSLHEEIAFNSEEAKQELQNSNISKSESIKVGVVSLGSFDEIEKALSKALVEIGIPVTVQEAELIDIINSEEFDIIYVRLARGKSPNITGLFSSGGLLDSYAESYTKEIEEVNKSKTWEELCEKSKQLEKNLREDGVWMFLDKAYDIRTTKK